MGIKGILGNTVSTFKNNFLSINTIVGNIFIVLSGGIFLMLFDAGLSNIGFYNKAKVSIFNGLQKVKTMLVKKGE